MGLMEREMVDRLGMVGQMGILELPSFQLFPLGNVTLDPSAPFTQSSWSAWSAMLFVLGQDADNIGAF